MSSKNFILNDGDPFPNKDTMIFGSFSGSPGNIGAKFFNDYFKKNNINAIYLPLKGYSPEKIMELAVSLNMKGFAISSPFKAKIFDYLRKRANNIHDLYANEIILNNTNTVILYNDRFFSFNTDVTSISRLALELGDKNNYCLIGTENGAYFNSWKFALTRLNINYSTINCGRNDMITASHFSNIENSDILVNCTPSVIIIPRKIKNNIIYVDVNPNTEFGAKLAKYQAEEQLEIYSEYFLK